MNRMTSQSLTPDHNAELAPIDPHRELHNHLTLRGDTTKKVKVESIYRESEESTHNVKVWTECSNIQEGKPLIKRVSGDMRWRPLPGNLADPLSLVFSSNNLDSPRHTSTQSTTPIVVHTTTADYLLDRRLHLLRL